MSESLVSSLRSMSNSNARFRSSTLLSEFSSAEMSLHAIYMHEVPPPHRQSSITGSFTPSF